MWPSETVGEPDAAGVSAARVLVVDDHALLRTGVANIINHEAGPARRRRGVRRRARPSRRSARIAPT